MGNTESFGKRLLIPLIEERARLGHARPYFCLPVSTDIRDGFINVTYEKLCSAVDRLCWFLEDELGPGRDFESFCYLSAPHDFRYIILAFAAMKVGRRAFFPSARNSADINVNLLEQCKCKIFLRSKSVPAQVPTILERRAMKVVDIPELEHFVNDEAPPPKYVFTKTFEQARFEPCVTLHTSGSTGSPKVIDLKHGWFTSIDALHDMPNYGGKPTILSAVANGRVFMPFPNFHSASMILKVSAGVYFDSTIVECPANAPLTASLADTYHRLGRLDASLLPPNVTGDIVNDPDFLENTRFLKYLGCGAGTMPPHVGEALMQKTHPINIYAATETGLSALELAAPEDFSYISAPLNLLTEFRPVSEDRYELVMVRNPGFELLHGIFVTFPELDEFPTKDLWAKHPTKPNHWIHKGRKDDMLVLLNGEKFVPAPMEELISSLRGVKGAVVAGEGQFQPCLIIEPEPSSRTNEQLLENIWPGVEEANESIEGMGKIARDHVLFASPDKPFPRAAKETVQRKLAISQYQKEIEDHYRTLDFGGSTQGPRSQDELDFSTTGNARASLQKWLAKELKLNVTNIDTDIFSQGMDSLGVMNLTRAINRSIGQSRLSPKVIYSNPTISKLASAAIGMDPAMAREQDETTSERMQRMFDSFAGDLPLTTRKPSDSSEKISIVVTGTTGSLGSYILHWLCQNPAVEKVICLNRDPRAADRQQGIQQSKGLCSNLEKAEFFGSDFSKPYFGLDRFLYHRLLESTTHIIHNAWPVDFNLDLESFAGAHIRGVRQFIDFSAHSTHGAVLYFISSIASVMGANFAHASQGLNQVPETTSFMLSEASDSKMVLHPECCVSTGYSQSKLISEALVTAAARLSGIPTGFARVGQLAGPVKMTAPGSMWPRQEWLPSIIASSKHLGKVPGDLGRMDHCVDWAPVDLAAEALAELVTGMKPGGGNRNGCEVQVNHIVNAHKTSWRPLVPSVARRFSHSSTKPEIITYSQWVDALKASASAHEEDLADSPQDKEAEKRYMNEENPAVKLEAFLSGLVANEKSSPMPVLDSTVSQKQSKVLRDMKAVNAEWMNLWLDQWRFCVGGQEASYGLARTRGLDDGRVRRSSGREEDSGSQDGSTGTVSVD